ncbi:AAA family ATPase [Polyangium spumosum]|uniref:AAA family ATPase n=1 Tax=Polyangium spumosum TaxID=889282 RepID=A0A6N7PTJ9_9BACT|nr:AAA family ATPase [Polyangium spumosum]MRG92121.1 AAA family ATPase [Polyangium spumosum]
MNDLPQYELGPILHEGPEILVRRARRLSDGASVTLKMPRSEAPDVRQIARIRHEWLITRDLDVPGVARVLGLEKAGASVALVLEHFEGRPLADWLEEGRPDLRATLRIGITLADTLSAVHGRGLIHKDVKPQNILVDPATLAVALTDFGIAARMSEETSSQLGADRLEGTLPYMSPEQTGRMNRVVDDRSDQYSLGVTLYEMLTGERPFMSTDPAELVHAHLARAPVPPHERSADVPAAVSAIVMKLLAKNPEDRYQGARGLRADLATCLARLDAGGEIAPFELGQDDVTSVLRLPQKLYGREAEAEALLGAFERACGGARVLVALSGYAGIGKSALVSEVRRSIAARGGYLASGKFDQQGRNAPYAAVIHALRGMFRWILGEPDAVLARFRAAIGDALGEHARVVCDLVPELARILGPQPPLPPLGPAEAQNRFQMALSDFLRALCRLARPLVLFLDDLQWADPASLKLLELALVDPEAGHLLVLGAYRDHEVDAAHPLTLSLAGLRKAGVPLEEVSLGPLEPAHVAAFLADALGRPAEEVTPLATLSFEKTHGNPFYLGQFLKGLVAEGVVRFDPGAGAFRWDLAEARARAATENVIDLLSRRVRGLPEATQHVLRLAACIGHTFDLSTLSLVARSSPRTTAAALWEALREGFVLPLDADYKWAEDLAGEDAGPSAAEAPFEVGYRFLHDRVQQAAYALIPEADRPRLHLDVGRLLLGRCDERAREDRLFEIVDHLDEGAAGIEDPEERRALARYNLAAGRRAKAGVAYEAAARYLRAGVVLLGEAGFEDDYELAFSLTREHAECEYLSGRPEEAEATFERLRARARTRMERAGICLLLVDLRHSSLRIVDSIQAGKEGLALLGLKVPETHEELAEAIGAEMKELATALASRRIEELVDAPVSTDPELVMRLELLGHLVAPMCVHDMRLVLWLAHAMVNEGLRHGHTDVSPHAYAFHAFVLCAAFQRYDEARQFLALAPALDAKIGTPGRRCRALHTVACTSHHFERAEEVLAGFERALRAGLVAGDIVFGCSCALEIVGIKLTGIEELAATRARAEKELSFARRVKEGIAVEGLTIALQAVANLEGRTRGRSSLSDEQFDEATWLARAEREGLHLIVPYYFAAKMLVGCVHGDPACVIDAADVIEPRMGPAAALPVASEMPFHLGLALASAHASAPVVEREKLAARLAACAEKLDHAARLCEATFGHHHALLRAEVARIEGRSGDARELYDAAVAAARAQGNMKVEALANERAAQFYLGRGQEAVARVYLVAAQRAYTRWGASAKVADMAQAHASLLGAPEEHGLGGTIRTVTTTASTSAAQIDLGALLEAAQALTSQIELDRVLEGVLRVVVASTGARRAVLMLKRGGALRVAAKRTVDPDRVEVGLDAPLLEAGDVPATVVQLVERTGEPVVLGDAAADERFGRDPFLAARRPRSVLCLGMKHKAELAGVVYLENAAAAHVFGAARVAFAEFLSAQAAVAVENALLVEEIRRQTQAIGDANERLAQELAEREQAQVALLDAHARLEAELVERKLSEQARAALEEELIRVQTPLIPLTDRVMVMPLVGIVDERRASQVLEIALEGVHATQAEMVILDITGVKMVDASVTDALLRAARALGLLGTEAVLTGMRPDVARRIVETGGDLGGIVTLATLQHGVRYALGKARRPR